MLKKKKTIIRVSKKEIKINYNNRVDTTLAVLRGNNRKEEQIHLWKRKRTSCLVALRL